MSGKYLWTVGDRAKAMPVGEIVEQRYEVVAPQIWLDTQPGQIPDFPEEPPETLVAYLRAYPHRLHLPEVYGTCPVPSGSDILLLDNVPIDATGILYPTLKEQWATASAVRQVYWLWQIFQLWQPLLEMGFASSLLQSDNLRVQGWRVRLLELYWDDGKTTRAGSLTLKSADVEAPQTTSPNLKDLAECWLQWVRFAKSEGFLQLQDICTAMGAEDASLPDIENQLDQLLLEKSAAFPVALSVVGTTTSGPKLQHNEDACYPDDVGQILESNDSDPSAARIAIVCDGVGGHEGGEVASQLAVRSLQLQLQSLITEALEQDELTQPQIVAEQVEAAIRIVNNLIAAKNNDQGRSERQRMGTTFVMALQLPQRVSTGSPSGNGHELYIAHVGDSRAYWLTADACHLLTCDDTVATREVKAGRSPYAQALAREDGQALTQALGTREADFVQPHIQRFLIEEDGLLVLCSDGLSDNDLVEKTWANYVGVVLRDVVKLDDAVQSWLDLASQKNGHDNISVVVMRCQVSSTGEPSSALSQIDGATDPDLTEASQALLYGEASEAAAPIGEQPGLEVKRQPQLLGFAIRLLILILLMTAVGFFMGWVLNRSGEAPTPSAPPQLENDP